MKTILLWDPRFPDRRPSRLTLEDTVAAAAVRSGVAAAADPLEAGILSAGGPLDPTMLTEVVIQHGYSNATRRVFLPYSVVIIGAMAGVMAAIGTPIAGIVTPTLSPVNTAVPTIAGTAQEGQILTASSGTWSNSPTGYAYQWKRGGVAISGSVNATRTLAAADVGAIMICTVTATNDGGSSSADTPGTVAVVAASTPVPVNTVAPVVMGTSAVGQTLTTDNGTWSNAPTSFAYAWRRGGVDIAGATTSTYTLVQADVGALVTCRVFATNAGGTAGATSNAVTVAGTPTIAFAVPAVSVAEGNSGTSTVSNTINVTRNGVTGSLTINLTYSGTATSGTDYVAGPVSARSRMA